MSAVYYFVGVFMGFIGGWQIRACLKEGYDKMYELGLEHGYRRAELGMEVDYTEQEGK